MIQQIHIFLQKNIEFYSRITTNFLSGNIFQQDVLMMISLFLCAYFGVKSSVFFSDNFRFTISTTVFLIGFYYLIKNLKTGDLDTMYFNIAFVVPFTIGYTRFIQNRIRFSRLRFYVIDYWNEFSPLKRRQQKNAEQLRMEELELERRNQEYRQQEEQKQKEKHNEIESLINELIKR